MRAVGRVGLAVVLLAAGCGQDGSGTGGDLPPAPLPSEVAPSLVAVTRDHMATWTAEDPSLAPGTVVDRSPAYPVSSVELPPDGETTVVVNLVGARGPSTEPCGADYAGEAIAGPAAVAIVVAQRSSSRPGTCSALGHPRTVEVELPEPLGGRTLVTWDGVPISVAPPQP